MNGDLFSFLLLMGIVFSIGLVTRSVLIGLEDDESNASRVRIRAAYNDDDRQHPEI